MNFSEKHQIHLEKITSVYPHLDTIQAIYEEAFPKGERFDFPALIAAADSDVLCVSAIVDGEVPIGLFAWCSVDDKYKYLMYLAIDAQYRGRQYGTKALAYIRENEMKDKVGFGMIEALEPEAENYAQRVARARLYRRNGFCIYDDFFNMRGNYQMVCMTFGEQLEVLSAKKDEMLAKLLAFSAKQNQPA